MNTILAGVQGAYNAVWVKGDFGSDTFYYGRGAGALPTGVAVVSDLMRVARELRCGSASRVSPFAFNTPHNAAPRSIGEQRRPWYLRFRVADRPGIIAALSAILAEHEISIDAVLQLPDEDWRNRKKWPQYERAICDMIERTSTEVGPWSLIAGNDKLHARVSVIEALCDRIESVL